MRGRLAGAAAVVALSVVSPPGEAVPAAGTATGLVAGLVDLGVYSNLDPQVTVSLASWASATPGQLRLRPDPRHRTVTVVRGDDALKTYPATFRCPERTVACLGLRDADQAEVAGVAVASDQPAAPPWRDTDGDGIPDPVDVLMGGKKTVLLATPYVETARKLRYPGGDMPVNEGVCTDVVVRALRNAGIDLQKEVFEDAGRAPRAYPAIRARNPSIDHRRVRNLMVYLERHFRRVPDLRDLLPGDIVLLDTFPGKKGVEHIGLVSDRLGRSGHPLIINAWTNGYVTSEMDLLGAVAAPAAYRVPAAARTPAGAPAPSVSPPSREALPPGATFRLEPSVRQVVLAVSPSWDSPQAQVSWWERGASGRWVVKGKATAAMLGARGMGWGRGLLPASVSVALAGPVKVEGDARAPAGVFGLPGATGYRPAPPPGVRMPYRAATAALRCVDDPRSAQYNLLVPRVAGTAPLWTSDEAMLRDDGQYQLTIVVDHNRDPVIPGAGSCIFIHSWPAPRLPSPGCTMLARADVARLLRWLDPAKAPVLVQLPEPVYRQVAAAWDLP